MLLYGHNLWYYFSMVLRREVNLTSIRPPHRAVAVERLTSAQLSTRQARLTKPTSNVHLEIPLVRIASS